MGIDQTRERVTASLNALNSTYNSFPVRQTSVSVDQETYERTRRRCEHSIVDANVRVHHDSGVLLLESDGERRTPSGAIETDEKSIEAAACRLVRERTGVSCYIVDLISAAIMNIHDTSRECEPIYRLSALFKAVYDTGELLDDADWHTSVPNAQHTVQAVSTGPIK